MKKLAQVFGFDRRKVGWYRDLALTTFAAIMSLCAIAAFAIEKSPFDRRLGIGALVIAVACWVITPNKAMLFGAVVLIVALQGWFAVLFSRDARSWWVALPATLLGIGFLAKYRKNPFRE